MGQTSSSQNQEKVVVLMALCHGEKTDGPYLQTNDKMIQVLATVQNCYNFTNNTDNARLLEYSLDTINSIKEPFDMELLHIEIKKLKKIFVDLFDSESCHQLKNDYEEKSTEFVQSLENGGCNFFSVEAENIENKQFRCNNSGQELGKGLFILFDSNDKVNDEIMFKENDKLIEIIQKSDLYDFKKLKNLYDDNAIITTEDILNFYIEYNKIVLIDFSCDTKKTGEKRKNPNADVDKQIDIFTPLKKRLIKRIDRKPFNKQKKNSEIKISGGTKKKKKRKSTKKKKNKKRKSKTRKNKKK